MRRIKCSFTLVLFAASLFFSTSSSADPVTIKGRRLAEIGDIVKTVTSSDFPELPKHSLLLYERCKADTGDFLYQPYIFTINTDGSLKKEYDFSQYDTSNWQPLTARLDVIQKMDVSISPKRFGMRRNIVYSTAGLTSSYFSKYGLMTLESNGTEDSARIDRAGTDSENPGENRNIWGNACLTVEGIESADVFVVVHSSKMDQSGNLYLKFFTVDRSESGWINRMNGLSVDGDNGDSLGWKAFDYSNGIRGVDVAAGDINGDGYKNEIAMTWNDNGVVRLYIYQVKKSGDGLSISTFHNQLVHDGYSGGNAGYEQACPNVVVGDFDGDGIDEAAFVGRVYPWDGDIEHNNMRVGILDYNGGSWRYDTGSFGTQPSAGENSEAPCRATRCDFDGDGKDELAILFFQEPTAGTLYPRLERWYCDAGSISPQRDTDHKKGGAGDTSVLGYTVVNVNDYYKDIEELQITAGPLTGTRGKAKLAEDVAISHVYKDASRVFVIPTLLDTDRNFAGFGTSQKIYENTTQDEYRRGALITADFANESLMLDPPSHTQDDHDESYVAVIQALPYHIDNVDTEGKLTTEPINYTFSGFDDTSGGKMMVAYSSSSTSTQNKSVSFNMASTTETISLLGDVGEYAAGYLKFRATEANIAGNFDPRIKAAAGAYDSIMKFVTDKIDTTTTNASSYATTATVKDGLDARQFDRLVTYTAPQHIWRYKILNNPLPSWYALGPKADYVSKDFSNADSQDRYITFSMYDDAMPLTSASDNHYAYQARHEEGNFFSYPSSIEDIEGYNSGGALTGNPYNAAWGKSDTSRAIKFEQSKIDSQNYDETVQKSELTKTVSAIASFFGAKDPSPLPPYTSHSESFVKKYSSSEAISIDVYGKSDLDGGAAMHVLKAMPYITREGTMKVGTAVELTQAGQQDGPALWRPQSLYSKLPDPSLVLPYKYMIKGTSIVAADDITATRVRGVRFYVPSLDLDSDNNILGGLQYKIKVPVYNASFLDANSFDVTLSYVANSDIDLSHPHDAINGKKLRHIQDVTLSLKGWQNGSRLNKGWAEFTWDVPETLYKGDGVYYFYIQIDSGDKRKEVHESRFGVDDTAVDIGGNNDGYFRFNYTSPSTIEAKRNSQASAAFKVANHSGNGTIFRTAYRRGEAEGGNVGVKSSATIYDTTGTVSVNARCLDNDNIVEIVELLGFIADIFATDSRDYIPVECEIEYTGDEYYHEAYFYGVNYKPGALDAVGGDFSKVSDDAVSDMFLVQNLPLVPGKTVKFMLNIHAGDIDWVNGAGFELVVPELAAVKIVDTDSSGTDSGSSNGGGGAEPVSGISASSGGGCGAVTGSLMLLFVISMIFKTSKRKR